MKYTYCTAATAPGMSASVRLEILMTISGCHEVMLVGANASEYALCDNIGDTTGRYIP